MSTPANWILDRLDLDIYKCITTDIATDEVIVTCKQLVHMAERHPEGYSQILGNLNETLQDPDYILRDTNHTDTGLVIRRIPCAEESLHLVLRICTNVDDMHYANSVITGWKVSPKRLGEYLRTGEIIYKRPRPC